MENINPNEQTSNSQRAQIQKYMENGHRITQLEALNLFGCMRLATRVFEMRERGIDVRTDMITVPSGKRVAQYYIPKV